MISRGLDRKKRERKSERSKDKSYRKLAVLAVWVGNWRAGAVALPEALGGQVFWVGSRDGSGKASEEGGDDEVELHDEDLIVLD